MNRIIEILLRSKNQMDAGIGEAEKSVNRFKSSLLKLGGIIGAAFSVTKITQFVKGSLSAWAEQERATASMTAALNANGEAGSALIPKLQAVASAIQDETGAADESTMAGMAKMRMLGVQTDKLGEAAKAVIALKGVGLEEAAAQKAVAMAMQGNYEMLNRYVPALRQTEDETEKARIVNELFATGYEQQKDLLDTTSGRWGELKGRIGDAMEEIGRAIEGTGQLSKALEWAAEKVKWLGDAIATWINTGGLAEFIANFRVGLENIVYGWTSVKNAVAVWVAQMREGSTAFSYLYNVAKTFVNYVKVLFTNLGEHIKMTWANIRGVDYKPILASTEAAHRSFISALKGRTVNETGILKSALDQQQRDREMHEYRLVQIEQQRLDAVAKLASQETDAKKNTLGVIVDATEEGAAEQVAAEQAAADKRVEIAERAVEQLADVNAQRVPEEQTVVDEVVGINQAGADQVVAAWKDAAVKRGEHYAVFDLSGKSRQERQEAESAGCETGGMWGGGSGGVIIMNKLPYEGMKTRTAGMTDERIVSELKSLRLDNQKLLRMG